MLIKDGCPDDLTIEEYSMKNFYDNPFVQAINKMEYALPMKNTPDVTDVLQPYSAYMAIPAQIENDQYHAIIIEFGIKIDADTDVEKEKEKERTQDELIKELEKMVTDEITDHLKLMASCSNHAVPETLNISRYKLRKIMRDNFTDTEILKILGFEPKEES